MQFKPGQYVIHSGLSLRGNDIYCLWAYLVTEDTGDHLVLLSPFTREEEIVDKKVWPNFKLAPDAVVKTTEKREEELSDLLKS